MTTKQGESYLKNKLFPVIENMETKQKQQKILTNKLIRRMLKYLQKIDNML